MSESNFWYGYLNAGEKSSPVLMDKRLNTANPNTIYVFNLKRNEIIEYRRDIIESKLRDIGEEENTTIKELKSAYTQARSDFVPRGLKSSALAEKSVTSAARKTPVLETEEEEYDELIAVGDDGSEDEPWLEDED